MTRLVIYCDGSTEKGNPSKRGVGAYLVYAEETGSLKLLTSGYKVANRARVTNNEMELLGILTALEHVEFARYPMSDFSCVGVRTDSNWAVQVLNREWVCKATNLKPLVKQIWDLCDRLPQTISFSWVPREENEGADALSKSAYGE